MADRNNADLEEALAAYPLDRKYRWAYYSLDEQRNIIAIQEASRWNGRDYEWQTIIQRTVYPDIKQGDYSFNVAAKQVYEHHQHNQKLLGVVRGN